MPSIKNQWVKPGPDINFASAVLVQATVAVVQNDVLVVTGVTGGGATAHFSGILTVRPADATVAGRYTGRLLVAKHAIPAGAQGVAVPWRIVQGNTAGLAVGQVVYLGAAGAWASAPPATSLVARQVGTVALVGASGRVLLAPETHADSPLGAADYHGNGGGSLLTYIINVTNAGVGGTTPTPAVPIRILDIWALPLNALPAGETIVVRNDGTAIVTITLTTQGLVARGTFDIAELLVPAGDAIDVVAGAGGTVSLSQVTILAMLEV